MEQSANAIRQRGMFNKDLIWLCFKKKNENETKNEKTILNQIKTLSKSATRQEHPPPEIRKHMKHKGLYKYIYIYTCVCVHFSMLTFFCCLTAHHRLNALSHVDYQICVLLVLSYGCDTYPMYISIYISIYICLYLLVPTNCTRVMENIIKYSIKLFSMMGQCSIKSEKKKLKNTWKLKKELKKER